MKRNNYVVSGVPRVRIPRSRFDLSHRVLTSGTMGYLYPFELQEVLPGDTFKVKTTLVTRISSALVRPIMDNMFVDVYYFYVPSRIVFDDWAKVFGESASAWTPQNPTSVPGLYRSTNTDYKLSTFQDGGLRQVGACFGLPLDVVLAADYPQANPVKDFNISVLPFRAFAKIYNDYFRDENLIDETYVHTGTTHSSEYLNSNVWSATNYTGKVPKVSKLHDFFTSLLPQPQKGAPVDLALNAGWLPVSARNIIHTLPSEVDRVYFDKIGGTGNFVPDYRYSLYVHAQDTDSSKLAANLDTNISPSSVALISPSNLWADGSSIGGFTVNDFRFAFQYQKMLERAARSGTRYVEYLESTFGVSSPDSRLQRPEFLGGKRIPIRITQVAQTTGFSDSAETAQTLGQVGAYSLSAGENKWTKSFVEHGFVIGVYCIRQFHSYQQGIDPLWFRKERTDFYDPVFANISEQPIYKKFIYGGAGQEGVLGYNEAWAEYRQNFNKITGQMNSYAINSLDIWHLGDKYAQAPTLNKSFIEETANNLDRVVTVDSDDQDQFILDFWVENIAVRPLPTYSVPGLIDHH